MWHDAGRVNAKKLKAKVLPDLVSVPSALQVRRQVPWYVVKLPKRLTRTGWPGQRSVIYTDHKACGFLLTHGATFTASGAFSAGGCVPGHFGVNPLSYQLDQ